MIKKLLVCLTIGLFGASLYTQAATLSYSALGATRTNITTSGVIVNTVTVRNNATTTDAKVYLYASPQVSLLYTNVAYTNYYYTNVTITNIYTNVLGAIYTNTYSGSQVYSNSTAAATNTYPLLTVITVPPTNTLTYSSPLGLRSASGLTVTNSGTNIDLTIDYTAW